MIKSAATESINVAFKRHIQKLTQIWYFSKNYLTSIKVLSNTIKIKILFIYWNELSITTLSA